MHLMNFQKLFLVISWTLSSLQGVSASNAVPATNDQLIGSWVGYDEVSANFFCRLELGSDHQVRCLGRADAARNPQTRKRDSEIDWGVKEICREPFAIPKVMRTDAHVPSISRVCNLNAM